MLITEHYFHDGSMHVYEYEYPTPCGVLEIFPEASDIVPIKLKEARLAKRRIVRTETKPYLAACNAIMDPFSRAFWKEIYTCVARGFVAAQANCERLERLSAILSDPAGARDMNQAIAAAKSQSITTLYNFKHLRRTGRGYAALCPIHGDKDPSFKIYPDNSWHCFGCGKGGDAIQFIMEVNKCNFHTAINMLKGGNT